MQQTRPDIELYHTDGEHAGPYGDFLIAAVFCRLLTGRVSDEVSGMGINIHVNDETGLPDNFSKTENCRIPDFPDLRQFFCQISAVSSVSAAVLSSEYSISAEYIRASPINDSIVPCPFRQSPLNIVRIKA